ncbi:MAG: sporulation protein YqfD [Lachnospiraceae bacterium]|nr:sporulation protein YqfD [Lachnospiraceae bacterium]
MAKKLVKWCLGYVKIALTGEHTNRLLTLLKNNGISLWDIVPVEHGYEAYMYKNDVFQIKPLLRKTESKMKILKKYGWFRISFRYRKRKPFIFGFLLCVCFIYYFTLFIWDIHIDGESNYTKEQLITYIKENYVDLGTRKNEINCEELEKELRKYFEEIAWINCELKGTQLIVHIRETIPAAETKNQTTPGDIVAGKDAVVSSIITRNGTPLIKKDMEVKKGDILISGTIYIYDDYNEILETNYVCADGDVYGKTEIIYDDYVSLSHYEKEETKEKKTYYSISLWGKTYTPYTPKKNYANQMETSEEIHLKLGENMYLPIFFVKNQKIEYVPKLVNYSEEEAISIMEERIQQYQDKLIEKGVVILENNVKIYIENGVCYAKGSFVVIERIGLYQEKTEQMED